MTETVVFSNGQFNEVKFSKIACTYVASMAFYNGLKSEGYTVEIVEIKNSKFEFFIGSNNTAILAKRICNHPGSRNHIRSNRRQLNNAAFDTFDLPISYAQGRQAIKSFLNLPEYGDFTVGVSMGTLDHECAAFVRRVEREVELVLCQPNNLQKLSIFFHFMKEMRGASKGMGHTAFFCNNSPKKKKSKCVSDVFVRFFWFLNGQIDPFNLEKKHEPHQYNVSTKKYEQIP